MVHVKVMGALVALPSVVMVRICIVCEPVESGPTVSELRQFNHVVPSSLNWYHVNSATAVLFITNEPYRDGPATRGVDTNDGVPAVGSTTRVATGRASFKAFIAALQFSIERYCGNTRQLPRPYAHKHA